MQQKAQYICSSRVYTGIRENDELYNTSFIFDKEGKIIGRHRKMHLFDIDVPGK